MHGPDERLQQTEALLREFPLGYPEAHEELPWEERAVKVNKRAFGFMRSDEVLRTLRMKPAASHAEVLAHVKYQKT